MTPTTPSPGPAGAWPAGLPDLVTGTLMERMGIEFLEVTPQRVVGRMPVAGNTQPYGLLHGGASVVLAETLGSVGAELNSGPNHYPSGVEVSATHHRSAREGYVVGVATPVHVGRSVVTFEIVLRDDADRRVCTARLTCVIRERPAGAEAATT